jgi:polyisoprenyl-phosphate glycosyltransferase
MSRYSLIIPVYRNEDSIPSLLTAVGDIDRQLAGGLEVIFVVDGSPDQSYAKLYEALPSAPFTAKLIALSRNFGSFAAIREGLAHSQGEFAAVMAADLQEPPELVPQFFEVLAGGSADIVFGTRESRQDPWTTKLFATLFWSLYRRFVQPDMPVGGVDVFALNRKLLDRLTSFNEANSSLLGLLFWMGGRRAFVPYVRQERQHGKSAWTFSKKFNYLLDSVFAFTDAPIRALLTLGGLGMAVSLLLGFVVLVAKVGNLVAVPGYAGTMLAILFFGGLNALGLGLVGNYAWRAYENSKQRPLSIALTVESFPAAGDAPHHKDESE